MSASRRQAILWKPNLLFHHTWACSLNAYRMKPGKSRLALSSFAPGSDISSGSYAWTNLLAISCTTTSFWMPHSARLCSSHSILPLNSRRCLSSGTSIVSLMLSFKLLTRLLEAISISVSWSSMVRILNLTVTALSYSWSSQGNISC